MTTPQNHHATDWNTVVADNIRAEMARQRWSGRKLATRLGVQPTWVNRRTSGATPLDPNDIALFADVLGVSIQSLFGNEKTPPTPKSEGVKAQPVDYKAAVSAVILPFPKKGTLVSHDPTGLSATVS